jgi:hypothetical protein
MEKYIVIWEININQFVITAIYFYSDVFNLGAT